MGSFIEVAEKKPRKIRIQKPHAEHPAEEKVWDDVRRFAKMVPAEPDPNLGRIQEIKDEIRKGTYLKKRMIEDTAAILSIRLLKGEIDSHLES